MIYFIQQGKTGPIKIGYSDNVDQRLKALQSASPKKLTLLGFIKGDSKKERTLHRFFHEHKMEGEWFAPAPKVLNYIFSLIVGPEFNLKDYESESVSDLDATLKNLERIFVVAAMKRFANNRTKAAQSLSISTRSLRYRLEKLKIEI